MCMSLSFAGVWNGGWLLLLCAAGPWQWPFHTDFSARLLAVNLLWHFPDSQKCWCQQVSLFLQRMPISLSLRNYSLSHSRNYKGILRKHNEVSIVKTKKQPPPKKLLTNPCSESPGLPAFWVMWITVFDFDIGKVKLLFSSLSKKIQIRKFGCYYRWLATHSPSHKKNTHVLKSTGFLKRSLHHNWHACLQGH